MTSFAKFFSTAATATLLATSAHALELKIGGNISAGADEDGVSLGVEAGIGAEAEEDRMVTADGVMHVDPGNAFLGDRIFTADDVQVGSVSEVMVNEEGQHRLIADVDQSVPTEAERFYIDVTSESVADGEIRLNITEIEFVSALNEQMEASATAD